MQQIQICIVEGRGIGVPDNEVFATINQAPQRMNICEFWQFPIYSINKQSKNQTAFKITPCGCYNSRAVKMPGFDLWCIDRLLSRLSQHASAVWNWYCWVGIAHLYKPSAKDRADAKSLLQWSGTSFMPLIIKVSFLCRESLTNTHVCNYT